MLEVSGKTGQGRGTGASSAFVAICSASTTGVGCSSFRGRKRGAGVAGGSSAASDSSRNTANTSLNANTSGAGYIVFGDDSASGSSSVRVNGKYLQLVLHAVVTKLALLTGIYLTLALLLLLVLSLLHGNRYRDRGRFCVFDNMRCSLPAVLAFFDD